MEHREHKFEWAGQLDNIEFYKCECGAVEEQYIDCGSGC